jgi:hypothetical protein
MNFILDGHTKINGDITINGILYHVKTEKSFHKLNNKDLIHLCGGIYDNITIDGNLIICDYKEHNLLVSGSIQMICSEIVE